MPDVGAISELTGPHASRSNELGVPSAIITPEEKSLPVVSTASRVSLGPAVNLNQTLLFVAGAPHVASSAASFASVVALVVSSVVENGSADTTVAPPMRSFAGRVTAAAVPTKLVVANTTVTHATVENTRPNFTRFPPP